MIHKQDDKANSNETVNDTVSELNGKVNYKNSLRYDTIRYKGVYNLLNSPPKGGF